MGATFRLEIATPDRPLLDKPVTEAQIPAANGYLGILPDHAPLIAQLGIGTLTYRAEGREESILIHEGFVEVGPEHVRVLAAAAELPSDVDIHRAQESYQRASERLAINVGDVDRARAMKALKRAEVRLAASKRS
jgi:F-type H+-transporting ATPase subunit epsilon